MSKDFVVRIKGPNEDKSVTMTIRIERELQANYDELAAKSKRSRNELINMALKYALANLKFIEDEVSPDDKNNA